jgi:5,10-methylene-tetrahydrofolate dehydrogenase/methenyl tetrahydrofolate cyclohydrolase
VQAALIGLTYAYDNTQNTFCLPAQLTREIVQWLEEKHIVIGGRGATSGAPIARYFDHLQIPYSTTNSQIEDADSIYRTADIIITGVGKKILTKMNIKAGVILLNFGLRQERVGERSVLKGDYDEDDISTTASLYTGTPGGLGPIDVTCMFANVVAATEKQTFVTDQK